MSLNKDTVTKVKFLIILAILFSGLTHAQNADYSSYHIVFDLDWTLLYQLKEGDVVKDNSKVVTYNEERFRITDHTGELIQSLIENYKGINISFYSGGAEERNLKVLEAIQLPNGQTALDIYDKLFSRQDLEQVSESKELSFPERNKKVLYNRIKNYDGDKVLLIDDLLKFSDYKGTEFEINEARKRLNTLFSFGRISFYEDKPDHLENEQRLHDPRNTTEWLLERNKTALMYGIISEAFDMEANGEGKFSDNVVKLHRNPESNAPLEISDSTLEALFNKGLNTFKNYKQIQLNLNNKSLNRQAPLCKAVVN